MRAVSPALVKIMEVVVVGKVFIRIDDRLIHGQIVTAWCQTLKIGSIIAIDDELAANPMLQSIMTMGVPPQYKTKIVAMHQAKELLKTTPDKNCLVIARYPKNLEPLTEEIKNAAHICLGNCSKREDSVHKFARGAGWYLYLSKEDLNVLISAADAGVEVFSQQLPSEKLMTWNAIKKEIGL